MVLLSAFACGCDLGQEGQREGKGPKDDKVDRPEGGQGKRPAGAGNRPSRGPPGLGIFADTGADTTPALLSTLPKARDGSLGLAANGQIMIVFQNRRDQRMRQVDHSCLSVSQRLENPGALLNQLLSRGFQRVFLL
eukprot:jgi/Picre1/28739/NNA_004139.t1